MKTILEEALQGYQKQKFFADLCHAYTTLQADSEAWKAEEEEREGWDVTLMDGQDEETPSAPGQHQV